MVSIFVIFSQQTVLWKNKFYSPVCATSDPVLMQKFTGFDSPVGQAVMSQVFRKTNKIEKHLENVENRREEKIRYNSSPIRYNYVQMTMLFTPFC